MFKIFRGTGGERAFKWATLSALALLSLFFIAIVVSLLSYTSWGAFLSVLFSAEILFAIKLSLLTATVSTAISMAIAIPVAYAISKTRFFGKDIVDSLLDLPIVISPVALGAALLVFFMARAISRRRGRQKATDIDETEESLFSWSGFLADVRLFFSLLWQRFASKRKKPAPGSRLPSWHGKEDVWGKLGIRDIYRHLLWEASCSTMARRSHETPYEYAKRLGQAVPEGSKQLNKLTDLYVDVRYGELEAEDRQVDYANSLWRVLQRLLERLARTQAR